YFYFSNVSWADEAGICFFFKNKDLHCNTINFYLDLKSSNMLQTRRLRVRVLVRLSHFSGAKGSCHAGLTSSADWLENKSLNSLLPQGPMPCKEEHTHSMTLPCKHEFGILHQKDGKTLILCEIKIRERIWVVGEKSVFFSPMEYLINTRFAGMIMLLLDGEYVNLTVETPSQQRGTESSLSIQRSHEARRGELRREYDNSASLTGSDNLYFISSEIDTKLT
ncbi:hypothetical protein L9F63_024042, partial [Diploptera punctata]